MPDVRFFNFDIKDSPTFDMDALREYKREAEQHCGPQQFEFAASKIFPLLMNANIFSSFLVSLTMLEFSMHVMMELSLPSSNDLTPVDVTIEYEKPPTPLEMAARDYIYRHWSVISRHSEQCQKSHHIDRLYQQVRDAFGPPPMLEAEGAIDEAEGVIDLGDI